MPDLHIRDLTPTQWWLLVFTLVVSLGFAVFFIFEGNYEFIVYFSFLLFFIFFILITHREIRLPTSLLAMLSLWSLLHLAGGGLWVGKGRLYEWIILPLFSYGDIFFLRYDQFVHIVGTGIIAASIHWAIRIHSPHIKKKWRIAFAALAAMGLGSLNEVIEFGATILLANTTVGSYSNNALDLMFNMIGALLAVLSIEAYLRLKSKHR